jgi:hypothetical protein
MIGMRPEGETLRYPVSELAAKHGASAAKETYDLDEAYSDWPGEYQPLRLMWPPGSETDAPRSQQGGKPR